MSPDALSPYHVGEQTMQTRAGVRTRAEQQGRRMIRDHMPDQHRALFEDLPQLWVGSLDAEGRPWASLMSAAPGFVRSPDPRHLVVRARPSTGDPLRLALTLGAPLGLLGIQLHTRRRNRVNGRVVAIDESGFALRVDQSFGNCPQYIAARLPVDDSGPAESVHAAPGSSLLGTAERACIESADTCFIASASSAAPASNDPREGVDVSHRGGRPGFVRVRDADGASVLSMPDFAGNNAFNTLGNLLRHPYAGLTFPCFETGNLLLVTGAVAVTFDGPELASFAGALRLLQLRVEAGLLLRGALPRFWSAADPAPQVARTGAWSDTPVAP